MPNRSTQGSRCVALWLGVLLTGCGGAKTSKDAAASAASGAETGWCGVDSASDPAKPGVASPRLQWSLPIRIVRGQTMAEREWAMITRAMSTWEKAAGTTLFQIETTAESRDGEAFPSLEAPLGDGVNGNYNDAVWESRTGKPAGVLATTVFRQTTGGPEADIRYNLENFVLGDAEADAATDSKRLADLESVALHEFGHLLSLAHVDETVDPESVMHLAIDIGKDQTARALSAGDESRIRSLYAP